MPADWFSNRCQYPLYLPKGSIRALLSFVIVGGAFYGLFSGKISTDSFFALIGMISGYYFLSRAKE